MQWVANVRIIPTAHTLCASGTARVSILSTASPSGNLEELTTIPLRIGCLIPTSPGMASGAAKIKTSVSPCEIGDDANDGIRKRDRPVRETRIFLCIFMERLDILKPIRLGRLALQQSQDDVGDCIHNQSDNHPINHPEEQRLCDSLDHTSI